MRKQIGVLLPLLGTLLLLVTRGCSSDPLSQWFAPTATAMPFELEQLLLDVSLFPPGWRVGPPPSAAREGRGQTDDLGIDFDCIADSHALHEVYQYDSERTARRRYQRYSGFFNVERITPWATPSDLEYESRVAERFRFACADFRAHPAGQSTTCQAMGQYNEFISVFAISFVREDMVSCMTWSELERILEAIDECMAHYLGMEGE